MNIKYQWRKDYGLKLKLRWPTKFNNGEYFVAAKHKMIQVFLPPLFVWFAPILFGRKISPWDSLSFVDKWKRMKVDKCIEIINATLEMLNNKLVGIVLMTMNEVLPDLHSQGSPLNL